MEAAALARRTSAAAAREALGQIHDTLRELAAAQDRIGAGADRTLEAAATAVQRVDEAMRGSGELQHSTDAAADVTREISAVADQTRLLALNAAIEAARAGEHGRGFAVVAHEVGELAQAAGGSAERVLAHIQAVTAQSSQMAASIEATSTALAAVNAATCEIEQSVIAQRTAEAETETTLTATTERLVQISERRANVRVTIDVPVRAVLPADGGHGPIDTVTTDLSLGGALTAVRPGMGEGPWQIELHLPDDPHPIHCTAELVHRAETHYGVAFADFSDTDLLRLDSTIQRRLRQRGDLCGHS